MIVQIDKLIILSASILLLIVHKYKYQKIPCQFELDENRAQLELMKKKSQSQNKNGKNDIPPKKFRFYLGSRERYIVINSDFDSGNIDFVRQISQFQYRLCSVHDATFTNNKVNSKSWFFFSAEGFPNNTRGKFIISKVQTLQGMYHSKYNKAYRPVYRIGQQGEWNRIETQCELVMRENGELECVFDYLFKNQEKIYFAFCYPFTYQDYKKYMNSLNQFIYNDDFYFHKEVLIKSPQDRDIHLITITSYDHQDKSCQTEQLFNQSLFPERCRPLKFKKPVILISARVHPGQTPASYAMKGVINFLISKDDLRATLLRKMFVFMIVPMINVDGVFHGHFRMDTNGKNLNRFYINPNIQKQPAVYAIKQIALHLNKDNRLSFYFDLHAHNAKKGCFIYGNAINDFVEQVESQVFCKLISMNNCGFEYEYCNFTKKHMNAKDRGQDLTKQGCGRVVMHRLAKIIHSYSVQCGIVSPNKMNQVPNAPNQSFSLDNKGFIPDRCQDNSSSIYKTKGDDNALFTIQMYENLGKNLMVSILDVFDKNPYNRIYNSKYKTMDMLRRLTAFEIFHEAERFRMFERFIFGKVKNINQLIREVLNTKLHYKRLYNFYFFDDKQLKNIQWPQNIPGLAKPKPIESPTRLRKFKSSSEASSFSLTKTDYSDSFMKVLMSLSGGKNSEQQQQQEIENNEQNNNDAKSSETQDDFQPTNEQLQYIQKLERMMDNPDIEENERNAIANELANFINFNDSNMEKIQQKQQFSRNQSQQIYENQEKLEAIQQKRKRHELSKQRSEPLQNLQLSTRLCLIKEESAVSIRGSESKPKENSSVRVRRLLRQQFINSIHNDPKGISNSSAYGHSNTDSPIQYHQYNNPSIYSQQQMRALDSYKGLKHIQNKKGKKSNRPVQNQIQISPEIKNVSTTGLQFRKNIYQSIKQEIKEELNRENYRQFYKLSSVSAHNSHANNPKGQNKQKKNRKQTSGHASLSVTAPRPSINGSAGSTGNNLNGPKICSPVKIQKERIKSWNNKVKESNGTIFRDNGNSQGLANNSKNRLQLPALGAQMYIISTSTKNFPKNG